MIEKYGSGRFCSRECANSRNRSEQTKTKIKNTLNQTLKNKPKYQEPFTYCYYGYYKGIYCASSYELIYLLYCEKHQIKVERCSVYFEYFYKDCKHLYIPDFYLPETHTVVELKGRGIHYDKEIVEAKSQAAQNSSYNYQLIDEQEFKQKYYK